MPTKASMHTARGAASLIAALLVAALLVAALVAGCADEVLIEQPGPEGGEDPPPADDPRPIDFSQAPVAVARCPDVFAQSGACLTVDALAGVVAVGMDDGEVCFFQEIDDVGLSSGEVGPGIAVQDDSLFLCGAGELLQVALATGAVTPLGHACRTVSTWGEGGLTLLQGDTPRQLLGIEATTAEGASAAPAPLIEDVDRTVSRHAVAGEVLYAAWHATDIIERYDLATEAWLTPLTLEGFDGWVLGIGFLASGQLAVPPRSPELFRVFDLETGAHVRSFEASADLASPAGLACDPYPDYVGTGLSGE